MSRIRTPRRTRATLIATAFVLLFTLLIPLQSASATDNSPSDYVTRINALRAQVGVQPLFVDAQLTGLAQNWANHMAATQTLAHSSLTAGITEQWTKLGENVGVGPNNATIWNAFLHSSEHYANLVDPAFNRVGVGVAFGGGSEWTVHKFMQLAGPSAPPPPPPAAKPRSTGLPTGWSRTSTGGSSSGGTTTTVPAPTTTTTAPPAPQAGPPPPANSQRVAAVLVALRRLST